MPRTGDEPNHARSPLRMRLTLACLGLVTASVAAVTAASRHRPAICVAFGVISAIALINVGLVVVRLRQGPHYQPGREIPAYRPAEDPGSVRRSRPRPVRGERARLRTYLIMMGSCLALLVLSWTWVRLHSVTAAVILTVIAMVIPPVASIFGNAGWDRERDE